MSRILRSDPNPTPVRFDAEWIGAIAPRMSAACASAENLATGQKSRDPGEEEQERGGFGKL